MFNNNHLQEYF